MTLCDTDPSAPTCRGWVDGLRGAWLVGWAYDPIHPERRLVLEVFRTGQPSVAVVADRYRADVQAAGHADGCCGFAIRMAPVDAAAVQVVPRDTGRPLGSQAPRRRRTLRRRVGGILLHLDWPLAGDAALTGYVLRPRAPEHRVQVGLRLGGTLVCRARATLYRPDLTRRRGGDGLHGFRLGLRQAPPSAHSAVVEDVLSGRRLVELDGRWRRACGLA